jgi:hypothetical protein
VNSGGLDHRPVPVLVQLADAEAEVVDDAFVLLAPGGEVGSSLLNVDEACVLAELGIDDPLLDRSIGVPEALVQGLISFDESALEEVLLVRELLLDGGLLDGELLDLRQQELRVGVHGVGSLGCAGVVAGDRRLGWERWWWRKIQVARFPKSTA